MQDAPPAAAPYNPELTTSRFPAEFRLGGAGIERAYHVVVIAGDS